jgi:alpha-ketoglutarate-dependent taurine dioxygenase
MILHPTGRFDNAPADNREIEVRPLGAAMGAEIVGVQLASLSEAQFAEVRAALFRHKMIYFRSQTVSHAEQERFSLRFGPFAPDAYTKGVEGYPDVQPVIREANERPGVIFGSGWHTDSPFLPQPPAISMLYGVEIPPWGGDTIWANSSLAYAALSDTMKTMLEPLRVRMSMRTVLETAQTHQAPDETPIGRVAATRGLAHLPAEIVRKVEGWGHPLVRTHPDSRRKKLRPSCSSWWATSPSPPSRAASAGRQEHSRSGTTGCASTRPSTTPTASAANSTEPRSPARSRPRA